MKKDIHPKYNEKVQAECVCGNKFTTGSTNSEIKVEICANCHPFYTGKQKLVDTAQRVKKFEAKMKKQEEAAKTRQGKKVKKAKQAEQKAKKDNKK